MLTKPITTPWNIYKRTIFLRIFTSYFPLLSRTLYTFYQLEVIEEIPRLSKQVDLEVLGLTKYILHSIKHLQIVDRFTEMCTFFITAERAFEIR